MCRECLGLLCELDVGRVNDVLGSSLAFIVAEQGFGHTSKILGSVHNQQSTEQSGRF